MKIGTEKTDSIMKAKNKKKRTSEMAAQTLVLAVVLACVTLIFTLINPNFLKPYNLLSMAQSLVPYALITLGELFVIATGNTDLSLGAVCIASAVMAGKLSMLGLPLWCVIPAMILSGVIFGTISGYFTAYKGIPSFIVTLGTMMFSRGISAILVSDPNIFYPTGTWFNRLFSNNAGFPTGLLWLIAFVLISAFIIHKSTVGRYILAIGSNPEAARISGIRSKRYIFLAFLFGGIFAGIAGIFWSSSYATVAAATGNGMEFDAIAAVFIGGTGASGGTASVFGSTLGMMLLVVIRSGLNFALTRFNIDVNSTYVTYVMTGIIIVAALLIDTRRRIVRPRLRKFINGSKKSKVIKIVAIVIAALVIIGAAGMSYFAARKTGGSIVQTEKKPQITIITKNDAIPFWTSVRDGCYAAGEDLGYDVVFRAPRDSSAAGLPEAVSLMQAALSNDSAGIGIVAICEGYTDCISEMYDAGVPVVQFDSGIYQSDLDTLDNTGKNPVIASVMTDCYGAAYTCGERCYEKIREDIAACDGEYLVGLIQYEQSETAENRVGGFIDGMRDAAEKDPETAGKCNFKTEIKPDPTNDNYKLALEALAERGARMIFCANETSTSDVYNAINASNGRYDDIYFAGFDCGDKIIEWIKREDGPVLLGSIAQNTIDIGYSTVECLANAIEGKDYEKDIFIDGIFYDTENIDELIEKGIVYRG